MSKAESSGSALANEIGLVFAFLFGCLSPVTNAFATEISATPGPQVAQSGVLQQQSIVIAQPTASTPAPEGDKASSRGHDQNGVWKRWKNKLGPASGNKVTNPDVSAILGPPLPNPGDDPGPHKGDSRQLTIFRNTTIPVTTGQTGATSEPSTDQSGKNIFSTANYHAEFSKDNGATWQGLDPFTIFGEQGFCCDQATIYDPSSNRQHWVLQYLPSILPLNASKSLDAKDPSIEDHLVLANSSPGDFINWCPYILRPSDLGRPSDESLDFNDLVVGTHYLYLTTRIIQFQGEDYGLKALALLRFPLLELAACKPAHFDFVLRTDVGEGQNGELRVPQGISDIAYAGANDPHGGQGSIFRLLVWPESSKVVKTIDRAVPPFIYYESGGPQCASEDGVVANWCSDSPRLFATKGGGSLWFSWDAQQYGNKRPFPYTRITQIRESDLAVVGSRDFYGLTVAHVQAAIAADRYGNIGLVDFFGGGKHNKHYFPSAMIAILERNRVAPPAVNFFLSGKGIGCNDGPGPDFTGAWGDFHTIRSWQRRDGTWLATTFVRNDNNVGDCPQRGASVTIKNVVFGR
ncbi:hypothetical protein WOC76_13710 [Methylocystis sp. IM3]|uniref:hypothetical protein n=1 Tax=unclassified Methylocystis TaxID=2625913 RepID=UPI00311A6422